MSATTICTPFTAATLNKSRKVQCRNTTKRVIQCSASSTDRRGLLLGLGSSILLPSVFTGSASAAKQGFTDQEIPITALNTFQKADIVKDLQTRAENELGKVLTGDDAKYALRLLLNDAATYNADAKTGGINGSIIIGEELKRPENADLKALVAKLETARKAIAASSPSRQQPISWADTIVLAVKVANEKQWNDIKDAKALGDKTKSGSKYPNAWPVLLGRVDATAPDGSGIIPPSTASPTDVLKFMNKLGVKGSAAAADGGPFAKKALFRERQTFVLWTAAQADPDAAEAAFAAEPDFAGYKKKYDVSRKTYTRSEYEVDFIDYVNKLANLGAKFDENAYLVPLSIQVPNKF